MTEKGVFRLFTRASSLGWLHAQSGTSDTKTHSSPTGTKLQPLLCHRLCLNLFCPYPFPSRHPGQCLYHSQDRPDATGRLLDGSGLFFSALSRKRGFIHEKRSPQAHEACHPAQLLLLFLHPEAIEKLEEVNKVIKEHDKVLIKFK
jgi:hypothetical protein